MIYKIYYNKIFGFLRKFILENDKKFNIILKYDIFYKNYLRLLGYNFNPIRPKNFQLKNGVLRNQEELHSINQIIKNSKLSFHPRMVLEKNWDSFIALNIILQNKNKRSKILDAGGELTSLILHWLYQFGYSNLYCINIEFKRNIKRGKINFFSGDIINTSFPDNYFDIIICLSVIEHGVDPNKYYQEMSRLLKKGGLLITSTDYWQDKIEIKNSYAFNKPVFIFDLEEISLLIKLANKYKFRLFNNDINLKCEERVVYWNKSHEKFTFLIFVMEKI